MSRKSCLLWKRLLLGCALVLGFGWTQAWAEKTDQELLQEIKVGRTYAKIIAFQQLSLRGKAAVPALPYMIKVVKNPPSVFVGRRVVKMIGNLRRHALPVMKEMKAFAATKGHHIAYEAARTIGKMGLRGQTALLDMLAPSKTKSIGFAQAMGIKPSPGKADTYRKRSALQGLLMLQRTSYVYKIQRSSRTSVNAVKRMLKHNDHYVRDYAIDLLALINEPFSFHSIVILTVREKHPRVLGSAYKAMAKMQPQHRSTQRILKQGLYHKNERVREDAVAAYKIIGPASVPILIEALKDPSFQEKTDAIKVLGSFGSKAKAALPLLKKLQRHKKFAVRKFAREASLRIRY